MLGVLRRGCSSPEAPAHHPHREFPSPHKSSCNLPSQNQFFILHFGLELGLVFSMTFLPSSARTLLFQVVFHILTPLDLAVASPRRLLDVPVQGIPALQHSTCSQSGAICQRAERALQPLSQRCCSGCLDQQHPLENGVHRPPLSCLSGLNEEQPLGKSGCRVCSLLRHRHFILSALVGRDKMMLSPRSPE